MVPFPLRCFFCLVLMSLASPLGTAEAGTFKNPELIDTSYDPVGVSTADLNHDGNSDVVYVDGTGAFTLHVLLGNGKGTFFHEQDI